MDGIRCCNKPPNNRVLHGRPIECVDMGQPSGGTIATTSHAGCNMFRNVARFLRKSPNGVLGAVGVAVMVVPLLLSAIIALAMDRLADSGAGTPTDGLIAWYISGGAETYWTVNWLSLVVGFLIGAFACYRAAQRKSIA